MFFGVFGHFGGFQGAFSQLTEDCKAIWAPGKQEFPVGDRKFHVFLKKHHLWPKPPKPQFLSKTPIKPRVSKVIGPEGGKSARTAKSEKMAINRHFLYFLANSSHFRHFQHFHKNTRGLIGDFQRKCRKRRKRRFRHFQHFHQKTTTEDSQTPPPGTQKSARARGVKGGLPLPSLGDRAGSRLRPAAVPGSDI